MDMPEDVAEMFAADDRVVCVRVYDGFVANSYKWRCPRIAVDWLRDGTATKYTYDAKRSRGIGPRLVGYSAVGGRLVSR